MLQICVSSIICVPIFCAASVIFTNTDKKIKNTRLMSIILLILNTRRLRIEPYAPQKNKPFRNLTLVQCGQYIFLTLQTITKSIIEPYTIALERMIVWQQNR